MLELGTRVKIKSFTDITNTLDKNNCCRGVRFVPQMKNYCGQEFKITSYSDRSHTFQLNDIDWYWRPEWFEVITDSSNDCLNDGSIEQRSHCLALIRQTMSGNEPNLSIFTPHTDCNCKRVGGFDYIDFPQDDWHYTIAQNIPDWPCLRLKPEVLEKAIKYCLEQKGLEHFKQAVMNSISTWFSFGKTKEGYAYWSCIAENQNSIKLIENLNKKEEHENQLQRKKSDLVRGTVPEGNIICGRKCKTSVSIGHLSYKVCSGI